MMRAAVLAVLLVGIALQPAAAEPFHREDLRIPMEAAGPLGLEAMLLRPPGTRRYPLALISHGAPREAKRREEMSPYRSYRQALEFARRGFAALVFMRRSYGESGGRYAESSGPCDRRDYLRSARASASDLRAAIEAMAGRTDISTAGMIAVGVSAGGFASLALSADPPQGLAAVINFAGGRGSRADNDVCDEEALVRAFAMLGKTSRIPTLWIYAQNDKYFGPDLVRRMHAAFTGAGGRASFIDFPPHGEDGHALFSRAIPLWTPLVDDFLRDQNLGTRDIAAGADTAAATSARQGPRGICRLSCREPAPGLCRLAPRRFRLSRRTALGARSSGGCPRRLRGIHAGLRAICGRRPSGRHRQRRIALKSFGTSGLPLGRRHHEAVEVVAHLDLAGQARVRPHVETEIQHVFFHRRRRADLLAPGFIDVDVAGRAGAGATAFGFNAGNGVADRGFHHGRAVLDFNGSFFARMVDKVDFGHDRSCCRNR